ncbi:DUF4254 domain-containing protein [Nocardia amamiensis]|uniref:DUF4254 domain-containing protein n=1 Tax=Nocardia amamiensis TaxID=404578 RepID=UPI00147120C4
MKETRPLLPSKGFVLEACTGNIRHPHPVLETAYELASLHEARLDTPYPARQEIDLHRARLSRYIDRWVASALPQASGAAYMHTETVGAVVDRLARYSVLAPHRAEPRPTAAANPLRMAATRRTLTRIRRSVLRTDCGNPSSSESGCTANRIAEHDVLRAVATSAIGTGRDPPRMQLVMGTRPHTSALGYAR